MLLLPKYGTIEVWAVATLAEPPTKSASSAISVIVRETRAQKSGGTRVRIGIYLKRQMTRKRARSYSCGEHPANGVLDYGGDLARGCPPTGAPLTHFGDRYTVPLRKPCLHGLTMDK